MTPLGQFVVGIATALGILAAWAVALGFGSVFIYLWASLGQYIWEHLL